ncbi:hypothetical protein [Edaphobacter dinghuensis]|nr:hypothetical protein [Edaphobacter dinghuensis]
MAESMPPPRRVPHVPILGRGLNHPNRTPPLNRSPHNNPRHLDRSEA